MNSYTKQLQIGFYENELCKNVLPFWLKRCEDKKNGGYYNCFSNDCTSLVSTDKYVWSQGRYLWIFAKLATMDRPFSREEKNEFLRLAKVGRDFIVKNCFLKDPLRCVFLTDEAGNPKKVDGYDNFDVSTSPDGFVISGLCQYAVAANHRESYEIAKELYISVTEREESFNYCSYPYPTSDKYLQHGYYMGWIVRNDHMTRAAEVFDPEYANHTRAKLREGIDTLLDNFVDENDVLREVRYRDFSPAPGVFGDHTNPGHALEEMWFIQNGADLLGDPSYTERCVRVVKRALANGWDTTYGGLYHFAAIDGSEEPKPTPEDPVEEPTYHQLMTGWGDKLWWVHSEALYSLMKFYTRTGDEELWQWYEKVFEYTFDTFPNPDWRVGEWVQIHARDGAPVQKVTSLPVKDPLHVTRDLICMLELLYQA